MHYRPLSIAGAWEITPQTFADDRGTFLEWFKDNEFVDVVGHALDLRQANLSVSRAGVVRGIHFADVPPGQAKYVTCPSGAVLDVVVDVRAGSPTFGAWEAVLLDDLERRAVYVSEGLGHAFVALADASTVMYLCSTGYNPTGEHGIDPLDPALGIPWEELDPRLEGRELVLSDKDRGAPTLAGALEQGLLPRWDAVMSFVAEQRQRHDERAGR